MYASEDVGVDLLTLHTSAAGDNLHAFRFHPVYDLISYTAYLSDLRKCNIKQITVNSIRYFRVSSSLQTTVLFPSSVNFADSSSKCLHFRVSDAPKCLSI